MRGDPAVRLAAVALTLGWSDPLMLLDLDPDDTTIAAAVVQEAQRLRVAYDQAVVEATAELTAGHVAKALARMFRR